MRPAPLRFTSPRWGEVDLLLAMPTGRANARPITGSASSSANRVRGHALTSGRAPHPDPLPSKSDLSDFDS
jgi:hypothetical protein